MKATATAPSNIAFIKYWGCRDQELHLPENSSLSMNLSGLFTTTAVEFSPSFKEDHVEIDGIRDKTEEGRTIKHLDRVRKMAGIDTKARVISNNNFPLGTGLSSSASGFAALSVAAAKAAGLDLSERELSILARQGSGSACRSIPDGFVEWSKGEDSGSSYAVSLYPADWWDIIDIVAVVSDEKKGVSSLGGHKLAGSSPFFQPRLSRIENKLNLVKKSLSERSFPDLGELVEGEALELHAIMLTSSPSLIYWTPGTLSLMKLVKKARGDGLPIYFTLNTGQNIHLICKKEDCDKAVGLIKDLDFIKQIIVNSPAKGARLLEGN